MLTLPTIANIANSTAQSNPMLIIVPEEAETVRTMFRLYLECGSIGALAEELARRNIVSKHR
jgi:Recombinase